MNKTELEIKQDEFGRYNGILPLNKPKWKTSHDMVDLARKKFGTKKIGHAGTLDPFAEGILILLIGRATKLSDTFLNKDKEYVAEILLGFGTETGDVEGTQLITSSVEINPEELKKIIKSFQGTQEQYVPVFSSVKVEGQKLRVLARSSESFKIIDNEEKKVVEFTKKDGSVQKINLPKKKINIYEIELISTSELSKKEIDTYFQNKNSEIQSENFTVLKIRVKCSKGTYIRQLAMDIGQRLNTKAMLISLVRTSIGDYNLENSQELL